MDDVNRLVVGLDKGDFKIYDDKVEQEITHFGSEDGPVSVVLAFDTSGSMGQKLRTSRLAVSAFLKASNPEDEFALVEFGDRVRLVAQFTSETGEIQNRLAFTESRGGTALVDAVFLALDQMKNAHHARKAILIISDGGDNSSRYSNGDLKKRAADVQIYSIGILESLSHRDKTPEEANGPLLLDEIATLTGGKLFEVDRLDALPDIAKRIAWALHNQYVLGYSPSTPKGDGRYHRITVKVQQTKGQPKLRTTFRSSYLSPAQ
jgi:VWFA-related protein